MNILLCVLDNDNFLATFPLAIAYLASVLRNEGHTVTIYNQDVHHYPDEHITEYLNNNDFDIVATGAIAGYYTYKKLMSFSDAVNKSKNRNKFKYVIGGHMVSADPTYFVLETRADIIVKGEGIETFKEIAKNINDVVLGTCVRVQDGIFQTKDRELIQDLDSIPFPAWDLFPMEYYRLNRFPNISNSEFSMSMISGYGCAFKCHFCFRLTEGLRLRSIENIVEEIKQLKKDYNITYIDFADDLTFASKKRTIELCEALLPLNIKWRCEGRLNYTDKEILKLVKRAGCVFINYGIEAFDDKVLADMNKTLTTKQIVEGIEATLAEGISPGLNFMFGNIGDNKETLKKDVEFLLKYDDGSQMRTIGPVQPYPGCELFETAKKMNLVKDTADFYENKLKNSDLLSINFTELTNEEFYNALYSANFALLHNYFKNKIFSVEKQLKRLYFEKDATFRGFRHN